MPSPTGNERGQKREELCQNLHSSESSTSDRKGFALVSDLWGTSAEKGSPQNTLSF